MVANPRFSTCRAGTHIMHPRASVASGRKHFARSTPRGTVRVAALTGAPESAEQVASRVRFEPLRVGEVVV